MSIINKNPVGRPKKAKTVTPGLRVDKEKWNNLSQKYPKKLNKMFNDWLDTL